LPEPSFEEQRRAYISLQAQARLHPNLSPPIGPNIQRCLELFLLESDEPFAMKLPLKNTLYNLMVFLDKNYESLRDPRVKDRLFLSYCEDQDFFHAGPLIRQYYSHFLARSQLPD
jgi:hypothetical protein